MKPVAQVRSYHYWSARLTEKVLEDNVERLPRETEFQIGSSSVGAFKSKNPGYATTRAGKALIIEELLSDHIVEDFDYRGPIDYLRAVTPLVIGSLRAGDGPTLPNDGSGNDSGAVYLFTESITQDGQRVAVCLFGSAKNILDHEPNVPLWRQYGWTCSHYAGLKILLHCAPSSESYRDPRFTWREVAKKEAYTPHIDDEVCDAAIRVCHGQGDFFNGDKKLPPWRRGYTLGDFTSAEWLAQIYFSTDNRIWIPPKNFDRVLVGSALWVRTPRNMNSLRWYDNLDSIDEYRAEDRASDRARSWWHIFGGDS